MIKIIKGVVNLSGGLFGKMKAKLLIKDEVQKLEYLSEELEKGNTSATDIPHWEEALEQMKVFMEHEPSYQEVFDKYSEELKWAKHKVRSLRIQEINEPMLITSSLRGLFDGLIKQREKNTEKNDIVVVLGDWMAFEGDKESIYKAMDLIDEGIIFLRGKNEEAYIKQGDESSPEVKFLKSLPTDVQTDTLVVTTGNSEEEPIQMKDFVKEDAPNLTGKTIITVHPVDGEDSTQDSEKNLILLAPGDAIKLNLKNKAD